jgi:hypothetical protein
MAFLISSVSFAQDKDPNAEKSKIVGVLDKYADAWATLDIENDPNEIRNLAYEQKYWEIVEELKKELQSFMEETEDPWKLKWNYE